MPSFTRMKANCAHEESSDGRITFLFNSLSYMSMSRDVLQAKKFINKNAS